MKLACLIPLLSLIVRIKMILAKTYCFSSVANDCTSIFLNQSFNQVNEDLNNFFDSFKSDGDDKLAIYLLGENYSINFNIEFDSSSYNLTKLLIVGALNKKRTILEMNTDSFRIILPNTFTISNIHFKNNYESKLNQTIPDIYFMSLNNLKDSESLSQILFKNVKIGEENSYIKTSISALDSNLTIDFCDFQKIEMTSYNLVKIINGILNFNNSLVRESKFYIIFSGEYAVIKISNVEIKEIELQSSFLQCYSCLKAEILSTKIADIYFSNELWNANFNWECLILLMNNDFELGNNYCNLILNQVNFTRLNLSHADFDITFYYTNNFNIIVEFCFFSNISTSVHKEYKNYQDLYYNFLFSRKGNVYFSDCIFFALDVFALLGAQNAEGFTAIHCSFSNVSAHEHFNLVSINYITIEYASFMSERLVDYFLFLNSENVYFFLGHSSFNDMIYANPNANGLYRMGILYLSESHNLNILIYSCVFLNISLVERAFLPFPLFENIANITLTINSTIFGQIKTEKIGSLVDFTGVTGVGILSLNNITVNNSSFEDSVIKIEKNVIFSSFLCSFNSIFVINYNGGVLNANFNNTISFENSTFTSITLDKFPKNMEIVGGFLYAQQANYISLKFCLLANIKASNEAAAIYLMKNNLLIIDSSKFSYNQVLDGTGSTIYAMSSNMVKFFGSLNLLNKNASIYFLKFLTSNNLVFEENSQTTLNQEVPDIIFYLEGEANNITLVKSSINFFNSAKITYLFALTRNYICTVDLRVYCFKSILRIIYSADSNVINMGHVNVINEGSKIKFIDDYMNSSIRLESFNLSEIENQSLQNENAFAFSLSPEENWKEGYFIDTSYPIEVVLHEVSSRNFTSLGLVYILNCSKSVVIENSFFISNAGLSTSALIVINGSKSLLFNSNNIWYNNGFVNGTVNIYLDFNPVHIFNNTFKGNKAISKLDLAGTRLSRGGGLNINSDNNFESLGFLEIIDNKFYYNYADYGGGLYVDIEWRGDFEQIFKSANSFIDNEALVGNDVASRINVFKLLLNKSQENLILNPIEDLFFVYGEDTFNNIYTKFDYIVEISDQSENFFFQVIIRNLSLFANFINIKNMFNISKNSRDEDVLRIECKANLSIKHQEGKVSYSSQQIIRLYQCPSGHYFDNVKFTCVKCSENTLKLKNSVDKYCESCDKSKINFCYGGNNLSFKEGFYRHGNSSQILKCKYLKACNQSKCTHPYRENTFLCSVCKEKYGMTSNWECIECSNPVSHLFLLMSLFFQFFLKAYSVKKAYKLTKVLKKENLTKESYYSVFDLASTNSCLKIMNIHLAFTFSLLSYPFKAIDQLTNKATPVWVSWTDPFKYSYECLFRDLGIPYHGVYSKMHMRILLPIIIVTVWFIYYGIKKLRKKKLKRKRKSSRKAGQSDILANRKNNIFYIRKNEKQSFYKKLIIEIMKNHSVEAVILIALYLSYDDLIYGFGFVLFFFRSKEDERDVNRMMHEPVRDWDSYPNEIYMPITLFLIIFFGVVIPIYIIARLKYTKKKFKTDIQEENQEGDPTKLENLQLFSKYGYFYYPYNKNCYYFEIFYMLKRVVCITYNIFIIPLISIHTKYESNLVMFINLEIIFLWIFFLTHSFVRPYRMELSKVNSLETRSSIILLTSFFFSALFFNDVDGENLKDGFQINANMALYLGIYVINSLYLVNLLIIIYRNEKNNIKSYIKSIINDYIMCIVKMICRLVCRRKVNEHLKLGADILQNIEQLDLNPLALWEVENTKRKNLGRQQKKTPLEKTIKSYKKKIEVLTLLVKMQRKELKKLKEILKHNGNSIYNSGEMEENSKRKINSMQVGRIRKSEATINHQSTFDLNNIPDDNEEIAPNKIKLDNDINLNMFLNFEFKERACREDTEGPEGELEIPEEQNERLEEEYRGPDLPEESLGKDKAEENITVTQINKLIGTDYEDYFLKIKVLMKNYLENIENICFKFNHTEDIFLKWKKGDKNPEFWLKDEVLKLTFYLKLMGESIPTDIVLMMELKSLSSYYIKSIPITLSETDFIKLSKVNRDLFTGQSLFEKKKEFEFVPFEFRIEKRLATDKQNMASSLTIYFPELFGSSDDSDEYHGSLKNYFRQKSILSNSKETNEIVEFQKNKNINTNHEIFSQRITKRFAKVELMLWRSFLYLDIEELESDLILNFRDLYCQVRKGENKNLISPQSVIGILKKFLSSRDLFVIDKQQHKY